MISTFSGCGSSSLGYRLAGFEELLAIDFDPNSCETFRLNFPEVPCWQKDITKMTGKEILDFCKIKVGELDHLDGSPPCQGFSTAGKRQVTDPRNDLFRHFVRLIDELQPKTFLMENVSGMVRGNMKGRFNEILSTLKNTGYDVKVELMNSMYFGVPQSRQRMIFLGVRDDINIKPSLPKPQTKPITVKEALKTLSDVGERHYWVGKDAYLIPKMRQGSQMSDVHPLKWGFNTQRLSENKPCPTITKTVRLSQTGLIHPTEDRFLTINELKRLASFPDDFRFIGKFEQQWARIGNAVMPEFMRRIAIHLIEQGYYSK